MEPHKARLRSAATSAASAPRPATRRAGRAWRRERDAAGAEVGGPKSHMGVSRNWGLLLESSYNTHGKLGLILGPLIFGNSHINHKNPTLVVF